MSVSGIYGTLPNLLESFSLKELLKGKTPQELAEEASTSVLAAAAVAPAKDLMAERIGLEQQAASEQDSFKQSSGKNLMSGNFFNANYEKSAYTKATLSGFEIEQSYRDKMNGLIDSLQAQADYIIADKAAQGSKNPGGGVEELMRLRADKAVARVARKEVSEASERSLEESRDDIDQAVEEAMAPKDAQGNPLPVIGQDSEAAPTAPAPEAAAPAPVDAAPAGLPAGEAVAAPVEASVDIVV